MDSANQKYSSPVDQPPTKLTGDKPSKVLRHVIVVDTKISHHLHTLTKPLLPRPLFLLLELSADFRLFFPISLALLFAQNPNPSLGTFLSPLLLGLLLDLVLVGLIKTLVRRSRPLYNVGMNAAVSVDHFSFPSGHASRVFFVASLFHLSTSALVDALARIRSSSEFVDRWISEDEVKTVDFLLLVVWAWALLTSVSRILLGRHFVFDVCAGACLGVLEGLFAFRFLRI